MMRADRDTIKDMVAEWMCDADFERIFKDYIATRIDNFFYNNDVESLVNEVMDGTQLEEEVDSAIMETAYEVIRETISGLPF